jgi:hypothetical protein
MDKKRLTYLLVIVVIAVWGNAIYRLFFYLDNHASVKKDTNYSVTTLSFTSNDTFSIHEHTRDPFLGPLPQNRLIVKTPKVLKPIKIIPTIIWPGISYTGMIRNQQSAKQLAMVVINGQSNIMKPGDSYMDIILNKVFKDSIILSLGKTTKTIHK